ncbi:hypothetical protein ABBQ32_001806 [Trebouxia sp. C0010 RCD-2024]
MAKPLLNPETFSSATGAPVCDVLGASQWPEEFAVTLCFALAHDVQGDMLQNCTMASVFGNGIKVFSWSARGEAEDPSLMLLESGYCQEYGKQASLTSSARQVVVLLRMYWTGVEVQSLLVTGLSQIYHKAVSLGYHCAPMRAEPSASHIVSHVILLLCWTLYSLVRFRPKFQQ